MTKNLGVVWACALAVLVAMPQSAKGFVGYDNFSFEPGDTLFTNPFDDGSNNVLSNLFPADGNQPEGTVVSLWDAAAGDYVPTATFVSGAWSADFDLLPGTGARLSNPGAAAFINLFVGQVVNFDGSTGGTPPGNPPSPFSGPNGLYLLGSKCSVALDAGGFPVFESVLGRGPNEGEQFISWDAVAQTSHTTTYSGGVWDNGEPTLEIAEAAFFNVGPVVETRWGLTSGIGDWATPTGKWDNGVPDASTDAYVNSGAGQPVFLTTEGHANKLVIGETTADIGHLTMRPTDGELFTLFTNSVFVGYEGEGHLRQTFGDHTCTGKLTVGYKNAAATPAHYELSNIGQLRTGATDIGGVSGHGRFLQTGGTHTTGALTIRSSASGDNVYELASGTLNITGEAGNSDIQGTMTFGGGDIVMSGTVDLKDATLIDEHLASMTINNGLLFLSSPQFDLPDHGFGSLNFNGFGMVWRAHTPISVAAGQNLVTSGRLDLPLTCEGAVAAPAGEALNLERGIEVGGSGAVDLGEGGVDVVDESSLVRDAGQLTAARLRVEHPTAAQIEIRDALSKLDVKDIKVGVPAGMKGKIDQIDGLFKSIEKVTLGGDGDGEYVQRGGRGELEVLSLGERTTGYGSYRNIGGALLADEIAVAVEGRSDFDLEDDLADVTVRRMTVGQEDGSDGNVRVRRGKLEILEDMELAVEGEGELTLEDVTSDVDVPRLKMADKLGSLARLKLLKGNFKSIEKVTLGVEGDAEMTQEGGWAELEDLILGEGTSGYGSYRNIGGELVADEVVVAKSGNADFDLEDDLADVTVRRMTVGQSPGSLGKMTLKKGKLEVTEEMIVGGGGRGELRVEGEAELRAGNLILGRDGEATFEFAPCADKVYIDGMLLIGPNLVATVDPGFCPEAGPTFHMEGSAFENESSDPAKLADLAKMSMIFEGGALDLDPFEVAGEDRSVDAAGFDLNFALGTLQIGSAADIGRLQLVDAFDNQLDGGLGNEALYVYELMVTAGSELDLNGLNLYYGAADIDHDAIVILNGGSLQQANPIPEPAGLVLIGSALLSAVGLARRRRS